VTVLGLFGARWKRCAKHAIEVHRALQVGHDHANRIKVCHGLYVGSNLMSIAQYGVGNGTSHGISATNGSNPQAKSVPR
jgi:hypothetical protein